MASWFRRGRDRTEPARTSFRPAPAGVDEADAAPDPIATLARAAYLQLEVFEVLSRAAGDLGPLPAKERVAAAAGLALAKHQAMLSELARRGLDRSTVLAPFADEAGRFAVLVCGADAWETVCAVYLVTGMLDDFLVRLAERMPAGSGARAAQLAGTDGGLPTLADLLRSSIDVDPVLAARLSLWGRRLVGDTLLLARTAARGIGSATAVPASAPLDPRLEPVFVDLIGAHTRRMDGLGLTA